MRNRNIFQDETCRRDIEETVNVNSLTRAAVYIICDIILINQKNQVDQKGKKQNAEG